MYLFQNPFTMWLDETIFDQFQQVYFLESANGEGFREQFWTDIFADAEARSSIFTIIRDVTQDGWSFVQSILTKTPKARMKKLASKKVLLDWQRVQQTVEDGKETRHEFEIPDLEMCTPRDCVEKLILWCEDNSEHHFGIDTLLLLLLCGNKEWMDLNETLNIANKEMFHGRTLAKARPHLTEMINKGVLMAQTVDHLRCCSLSNCRVMQSWLKRATYKNMLCSKEDHCFAVKDVCSKIFDEYDAVITGSANCNDRTKYVFYSST